MKPKLLAAVIFVVVSTATLSLWLHHRVMPAKKSASGQTEPETTSRSSFSATKMPAVVVAAPSNAFPVVPDSRSAIRKITDDYSAYEERLKAIHSLPAQLSDSDWDSLREFLLKPGRLDHGQLGQVIKNELLDVLCALNPPPDGLGDTLIQMYRDRQQEEVIRDYAVQHLTAYYEQLKTPQEEAKQTVQDALWEAVNETGDSIAGTALLGLTRLSQIDGRVDSDKIAVAAIQMAGDGGAGELTHITALQVCAQLNATNALAAMVQSAQAGETASVKISAIGALGQLGGPEQIPFLNSVLLGGEERLKPVAQHALERITFRENQLLSQK